MAENFKLPGSSYEELVKIIKAYATGKVGTPLSLEMVAQTASMDKTIVSRNNGFLVQLGIISEGNKKSPTQTGSDLGRAYTLKMDDEIVRIWRSAIENDEFLNRMLSAIRIRNGMEKASFINHILYSSGSSTNNNTRAGANTIIEIYKTAGLICEDDGKIIATGNGLENHVENSPSVETKPVENTSSYSDKYIESVCVSKNTGVSININVNVTIDQLKDLPEKIKDLLTKINNQE